MRIIEIIFILLLLLPMALLMRHLVKRLSAQTPKQRRSQGAGQEETDIPSVRAWLKKKNQQIDDYDDGYGDGYDDRRDYRQPDRTRDPGYHQPDRTRDPAYSSRAGGSSGYSTGTQPSQGRSQTRAESERPTRSPAPLKRTQRIPFSEMYGIDVREGEPSSAQAQADRAQARAARTARSERAASKREKRKRRKRARKRELKRRDRAER